MTYSKGWTKEMADELKDLRVDVKALETSISLVTRNKNATFMKFQELQNTEKQMSTLRNELAARRDELERACTEHSP